MVEQANRTSSRALKEGKGAAELRRAENKTALPQDQIGQVSVYKGSRATQASVAVEGLPGEHVAGFLVVQRVRKSVRQGGEAN
jgi:hypothetical protein